MRSLRDVHFAHVPEDVSEYLKKIFVYFSSTSTTEDSFHYVKNSTLRQNPLEKLTHRGAWGILMRSDVLRG
eukprot:12627369-Alexandrium_andersonii.AAC.1